MIFDATTTTVLPRVRDLPCGARDKCTPRARSLPVRASRPDWRHRRAEARIKPPQTAPRAVHLGGRNGGFRLGARALFPPRVHGRDTAACCDTLRRRA